VHQWNLHDHDHISTFLEGALILPPRSTAFDPVADGAPTLGGEERSLSLVVVKELLSCTLEALVSRTVLDDGRAGALAGDHQNRDGWVSGRTLVVEEHGAELRLTASGQGHKDMLGAHEVMSIAWSGEIV
jgi:hypothetical protein